MSDNPDLLRPCPFCQSDSAPVVIRMSLGSEYYYVNCDRNYGGCGATGPTWTVRNLAVLAWNGPGATPELDNRLCLR